MPNKNYKGLSREQVRESRRKYGSNVLTPPERTPLWRLYLEKFADPIIRILLLALAASFVIATVEYTGGHDAGWTVFLEPIGIFIAIFLATYVGFIFEVKAAREFDILSVTDDERPVQTIRDGHITTVPCCDVVVGDIVLLNGGDKIPADAKLLESVSLQVSEAVLTGEQLTHKSATPTGEEKTAYPANRVLRDTVVMGGHGVCKVEAVGDNTESGRLLADTQHEGTAKTPLTLQLDKLGGLITKASYAVAALIIVGRLVAYTIEYGGAAFDGGMHFWAYLAQSVMLALTLIVVAVPEGLPMSVTLSLALSMRRMLKTGNLVRKMHACETMGACTVICTDKTGTLTENRMTVAEVLTLEAIEARELTMENMAVNATAHLGFDADEPRVIGNPTEGALLLWLRKEGCDYGELRAGASVIAQLPFDTERKYMATLVNSHVSERPTPLLYVKGAPEILIRRATGLDEDTRQMVAERLSWWQGRGMRTLALAYKEWDGTPVSEIDDSDVNGLTLLSFVAINDPVRADVPDAVADCGKAGISLKVVTGDTSLTAHEVAVQIGLPLPENDALCEITGQQIAAMTDAELEECAARVAVVSRARPSDKRRLVEALTRRGEVVAVTGDGTNDAPALKAAHVGLSMGDGTSVAKEASEITILDNSFASIARAVMWGRSLYRNIRRFLLFQLTINVVACIVVAVGAFWGTQAPLSVTQMLWVNLIMDTFAALALASLPPEREVMSLKPRRAEEPIVSRPMWVRILSVGILFTAMLLGLLWVFHNFDITPQHGLFSKGWQPETATHDPLSRYEESLFFTYFVFLQFWNLFNVRVFGTGHSAVAGLRHCRWLLLVAVVILVGQVLLVEFGGALVGTQPLDLDDWLVAFASTSLVLWFGELARAVVH